jgi:hypothetical protein
LKKRDYATNVALPDPELPILLSPSSLPREPDRCSKTCARISTSSWIRDENFTPCVFTPQHGSRGLYASCSSSRPPNPSGTLLLYPERPRLSRLTRAAKRAPANDDYPRCHAHEKTCHDPRRGEAFAWNVRRRFTPRLPAGSVRNEFSLAPESTGQFPRCNNSPLGYLEDRFVARIIERA